MLPISLQLNVYSKEVLEHEQMNDTVQNIVKV